MDALRRSIIKLLTTTDRILIVTTPQGGELALCGALALEQSLRVRGNSVTLCIPEQFKKELNKKNKNENEYSNAHWILSSCNSPLYSIEEIPDLVRATISNDTLSPSPVHLIVIVGNYSLEELYTWIPAPTIYDCPRVAFHNLSTHDDTSHTIVWAPPHMPGNCSTVIDFINFLPLPKEWLSPEGATRLYYALTVETEQWRHPHIPSILFSCAARLLDAGANRHEVEHRCDHQAHFEDLLEWSKVLKNWKYLDDTTALSIINHSPYFLSSHSRSKGIAYLISSWSKSSYRNSKSPLFKTAIVWRNQTNLTVALWCRSNHKLHLLAKELHITPLHGTILFTARDDGKNPPGIVSYAFGVLGSNESDAELMQ